MLKTYHGGCHCGAVKFEADLDLSKGLGKCNCSICTKKRNWGITIRPDGFRLLTDPAALTDYSFGSGSAHHLFCKTCGIHTFGRGFIAEMGGEFVSVQVAALDDVTPEELIEAPTTYYDGKHDNWWNPPAETRHQGNRI